MSEIVTGVFKATIGWLVNKGRDMTAEKLKEGDVADQKIRDLIVREVEDIKSKLDGLSRKDLLAAVDCFKTGIRYFFEASDVKPSGQASVATAETSVGITDENSSELGLVDAVNTVSVAVEMGKFEKTDFSETMKNNFFQAKKRFEMAREKATEACNNEALKIFDRITAIQYRVMATVLESVVETVGTAGDMSPPSLKIALKNALPECEECLQKLHSLPAVQENFKVELDTGALNVRGRYGKDERRKIISMVCQVNRAIYSATQAVGKDWVWPFVDTGEDKVDPLRDERVSKVLRKVNMEHCFVTPWSFGQEGKEEHKLKHPFGIATNTRGQFLIADGGDKTLKVFDGKGKFYFSFKPHTDDAETKLNISDVATADVEDKIYLLVGLEKPGYEEVGEVQVFNKTADLLHKFPVRRRDWYWDSLTVSRSKVLELAGNVVDVHELSGKFVCRFGQGVFKDARDITATCDCHVMIVDRGDSCVNLFTEEGEQLAKFNINMGGDRYYRIACHPTGEYVVVAGEELGTRRLTLAMYTVHGKLVRRIQLDGGVRWLYGISVTMQGHIAVVYNNFNSRLKEEVIVV